MPLRLLVYIDKVKNFIMITDNGTTTTVCPYYAWYTNPPNSEIIGYEDENGCRTPIIKCNPGFIRDGGYCVCKCLLSTNKNIYNC